MQQKQQKSNKVFAVAMSGGVDSSVVAAILQKAGHDVFGITMDIHENCTQDIEDAQRVCKYLGIEHIVFDVREIYKKKVIDLFVEYYSKGLTPNPCSFCNRDLKLNLLVNFAKEKGADLLATGHYARLHVEKEKVILSEGSNIKKDQSYFVSLAPRLKLMLIRFPLEDTLSKNETRKIALEFGLPNFKKSDSQDICFIRNGSYKEFLQEFNIAKPGYIKLQDTEKIIGEHQGIMNYTVGQRKGLGISSQNPLYVVKLDPNNNDVIVGVKESLDIRKFNVIEMNWILDIEPEFNAYVKIRSFGKKTQASITKTDDNIVQIKLHEKSPTPVTNGQVCVMYNEKNQVVGAGIINYLLQ